MNFWDIIVKTNTFNFIIFVIIILFIMKAIDVQKIITGIQNKIIETIKDSEDAKAKSETNLSAARIKSENTDNDINNICRNAEKTASGIAEKIAEQANEQVKIIGNNTQKIINNNEKITRNNLSNVATQASFKLVENNLVENLAKNPSLHNQFIDDAIAELDTLEI